MKALMLFIILFYRKVFSPLLPPRCRFYPTCSQYAYDAIIKYGCKNGFIMTLKRVARCHPLNPGGYDPV